MKIIALGDTHGRKLWKSIVAAEQPDKIIFIGDYFDSHEHISARQQKENFADILAFKKANKQRVILLTGNHDYHYLSAATETYSGYQQKEAKAFGKLLQPAFDEGHLQMCFVWKNLLFSHAGVTKTWCRNHSLESENIGQQINRLFHKHPEDFEFELGRTLDLTGDDPEQSPIWVRPPSLLADRIDGFIQIAGHTVQKKLLLSDEVIFIDTLGTSGEYLIWEDGELKVGKLPGPGRRKKSSKSE